MTLEQTLPIILETLQNFLGRPICQADLYGSYESIGADSMDMVALAFEIETRCERPFEPELFIQHDTVIEALEAYFAYA